MTILTPMAVGGGWSAYIRDSSHASASEEAYAPPQATASTPVPSSSPPPGLTPICASPTSYSDGPAPCLGALKVPALPPRPETEPPPLQTVRHHPQVRIPPGQPDGEMTYTVKPGDSPDSILEHIKQTAPRFAQSLADLLSTNPGVTTPPAEVRNGQISVRGHLDPQLTTPPAYIYAGQHITLFDAAMRQRFAQVQSLIVEARSATKANTPSPYVGTSPPPITQIVNVPNAALQAKWNALTRQMTSIFDAVAANSPVPDTFAPTVAKQLSALAPGNAQFQQAVVAARHAAEAGWAQQGRTQSALAPIYSLTSKIAEAKSPTARSADEHALQTVLLNRLNEVGNSAANAEQAIQTDAAQLALWGPQEKGVPRSDFAQALGAAREAALNGVANKIATAVANELPYNGPRAAADLLAQQTAPTRVSSQMVARILKLLLPTVLPKIGANLGSPAPEPWPRNPSAYGPGVTDPNAIIEDISKVVGYAAVNSDVVDGTWESSAVQQAVEGTAKVFAQDINGYINGEPDNGQPGWQMITDAITHAVGAGANPTFALELANQIQRLPRRSIDTNYAILPNDPALTKDFTLNGLKDAPKDFANSVLDAVTAGANQQVKLVISDSAAIVANAQFEYRGADEYGEGMPAAEVAPGVRHVEALNPAKVRAANAAKPKLQTTLNEAALNALLTQQAIVFYENRLKGLSSYKGVADAGTGLTNNQEVAVAIASSPDALSHLSDQAAQIFKGAAAKLPANQNVLNVGLQGINNSEFVIEQGTEIDAMHQFAAAALKVGGRSAAGSPGVMTGLFLVGAAGTAANALYLRHMHFSPFYQKAVTEAFVGGFALYKFLHVAGIVIRKLSVPPGRYNIPAGSDASTVNKMTTWVIDGRPELKYVLRGLFALAGIADTTNAVNHFLHGDWTEGVTSTGNSIADISLFLLQNGAITSTRRITPSEALTKFLHMGYDPVPAAVESGSEAAAEGVAKSALGDTLLGNLVTKLPFVPEVPYIGWAVTFGYSADAIANFGIATYRNFETSEADTKYVSEFLQGGAGMDKATADMLAYQDPATGQSPAPALFAYWKSQGANPSDLVAVLNKLGRGNGNQLQAFLQRLPTVELNQLGQSALTHPGSALPPNPLISTNEENWLFDASNGLPVQRPPVTFDELAEWASENHIAVPDGNPATTLNGGFDGPAS